MASPSKLPSRRPVGGRSRPVSMIEGPMLNLNLNVPAPKESTPTPRSSKRRSLLPQFARKFSGEQSLPEEDIAEDVESRRGSVAGSTDNGLKEVEARKAVGEADRKAMPPPSKLGRPMSMFGAGGLGRAASVRSYARETPRSTDARADALAALTGGPQAAASPTAAQDTGLKRASSTRLPQSPASRGLSRTASVKPKDPPTRTSSTAKSATSITEKRSSVTTTSTSEKRSSIVKTRPPSIDSLAKARPPSVTSPASPARSTTSRHSTSSRPLSQVLSQPSRPSFSTYQQHYSPAKSALPKPPVPAARNSKPPAVVTEDDTAPSFEVQKQQNELLALSLLHQAALRTKQEYDASAHRKLGRKQALLRKDYEALHALEDEQSRLASLVALDSWCSDATLLAENLQTASRGYTELTTLSENGGRYQQLVSTFEKWIDIAEGSSERQNGGRVFVEALPHDWHKAHTSLALRLRTLQRELGLLPPAPPRSDHSEDDSALKVLLDSCETLLAGMLKELELMSKLERGILQREKERVDDEVKKLTIDDTKTTQWVPAWQSVA
ncbi:hypothetical protein LTR56_017610 [Elasticomyces elasticus]|nr:hypothetical protein LTR22_026091 [Elasticomyces elasticus]KAK3630196.1 hypothetical protein LTR56_017610 [Elasticomyces elasticus]KAK4903979.1 hypothetical protein LTR49_026481 [Elasticomyces elasticus]KAK5757759.1 hypothetical protein LTS12_012077 [Elasticomyces elasticus]